MAVLTVLIVGLATLVGAERAEGAEEAVGVLVGTLVGYLVSSVGAMYMGKL